MRNILRFRVLAMVLMALGLFVGTFANVGAAPGDKVLVCNIKANAGAGRVIEVSASVAATGATEDGEPLVVLDADSGFVKGDTGCAVVVTPSPTPVTPSPTPVTPDNPSRTGEITVLKRFCQEDFSENENSNCNGRTDVEGLVVDFQVFNEEGDLVDTIEVTIGNQGNGSQGQETGIELEAGATFLVCEVDPEGFIGVPRPGSQGGANQEEVDGCIEVTLTPGNNVLQFDNFAAPVETPVTPVETPVTPVETPVTPVETPTETETETATETETETATETETEEAVVVRALPSTGQGADAGTSSSAIVFLLGAMSMVTLAAGFAWRLRHTA